MPPRVFAVSDLHTDMRANMDWVCALDRRKYLDDACIVAGDVAEDLAVLMDTFRVLRATFADVFFAAGNHDVWDAHDSLGKLDLVYERLTEMGVHCEPALLHGKVWVCPLDSWHSFDEHAAASRVLGDGLNLARLTLWRDFEKCHWLPKISGSASTAASTDFEPHAKLAESRAVCRFMLERNEERIARVRAMQAIRSLPVISFSHFVPRHDLNPTFNRFKELTAVSVCDGLDAQVRELSSRLHVFGHTHHRMDTVRDGVRYVQFPLGYKGEGAYCPRFSDLTLNEIELDKL